MSTQWKTWQQMEKAMEYAQDANAEAKFIHPCEAMDRENDSSDRKRGLDEEAGPVFGEVLMRFNASCLPSRNAGTGGRWLAGFHCYVAMCYRLMPEMFENLSLEEIAKRSEVSLSAFGKQLEFVDAIIAGRAPPVIGHEER